MKTFGKRPTGCPRLRAKNSYAKLVEDREQKQTAWAKSVQQVAQIDIDDIFAPIQQRDEKNVDDGVVAKAEIDPLAAEILQYEAEGWIAPPENNDSDIDDYYEDYAESDSGDEEDEEDEEEGDPHEHREVIERVDEVEVCVCDAESESGDGKDVEEVDPHQRHEVVERVNEVPLVSRTYTKDDEEVSLTLTLT